MAAVVLAVVGCYLFAHFTFRGLDYDPREDEHLGREALEHIHFNDHDLPESAYDFWVFDGGSFSGSIYYVSFRCNSLGDCWDALAAFGAPDKSRFNDSVTTEYAVNQHGPSYYWRGMSSDRWNVATIQNGKSYETARDDRVMDFWAVDCDTLTVYYHHESGGFSTDPPSTRHRWPDR